MKVWQSAAGYYFYQDDRGRFFYYGHKTLPAHLVKEAEFLVVKCNEAYYKLTNGKATCVGRTVDLDVV